MPDPQQPQGRKRKRSPSEPVPPAQARTAAPPGQRGEPSTSAAPAWATHTLISPPPSPTSLPPSILAQAGPDGLIAGRTRAHTRFLNVRANHAFIEQEREVMRAELEVLKAEERRIVEQKERLLDELFRRDCRTHEADHLIYEARLPMDGSIPPWLPPPPNGVVHT